MVAFFPALFLLPTLHLHPEHEHTHGADGTHRHGPVVHTDFLPLAAHPHGKHSKGHRAPDDSSPQPSSQFSYASPLRPCCRAVSSGAGEGSGLSPCSRID